MFQFTESTTWMYGNPAISREFVDDEGGRIILLEPYNPIPKSGYINKFVYYAKRSGTAYLQIYRKESNMKYKSVYIHKV